MLVVALAHDRLGEGLLPLRREREQRNEAALVGVSVADLAREPRAHVLGDHADVAAVPAGLGDPLEDSREIAHGDALGQEVLQYALDAAHGDLARHHVRDQLLVALVELVEELLRLRVGEQLGHGVLDHLGQMRGDHRLRLDHRVAAEGRFLAVALGGPERGQAEGRLGRGLARQADRLAAGAERPALRQMS